MTSKDYIDAEGEENMNSLRAQAIKVLQSVVAMKKEELDRLLEVPPDSKLGDLAFPCFVLAKKWKKAPGQVAFDLRKKLAVPKGFKKIEIAGPYLNFFYDEAALSELVLKESSKKGFGEGRNSRKIMVEYSNPNPLKGFHVGHLRNTALGAALCRILEKSGYKIIRVNYYNDTGSHVSKTLWAYNKWFKSKENEIKNKGEWVGEIYSEAELKLKDNKKYKTDIQEIQKEIDNKNKQLLLLLNKMKKWSIEEFDRIYKELGAEFDYIYYDKDFIVSGKKVVNELKKHQLVEYEYGAPIINLEKFDLGKKPLLRSDETALYITKDLAMAQKRFKDYKLDRSIYVVGAEQDFYFKQLFKTLEILGFDKANQLYHLSYELVLDANMKKFSSRLGTAPLYSTLADRAKAKAFDEVKKRNKKMTAKKQQEIGDKIAVGAMIYLMLSKSNTKRIPFNLDEALSLEGNTGPYLQYALVRASKIMKKSKQKISGNIAFDLLSSREEQEMIKQIAKFPAVVELAAENYSPHLVANFAYELAQKFSTFYEKCRVVGAPLKEEKARLLLVKAFYETLKKALTLLGIKEVQVM